MPQIGGDQDLPELVAVVEAEVDQVNDGRI